MSTDDLIELEKNAEYGTAARVIFEGNFGSLAPSLLALAKAVGKWKERSTPESEDEMEAAYDTYRAALAQLEKP